MQEEPGAKASATMLRGWLINEIHRGKQLRKVEPREPAVSSTLARAGFLHELRSKRPKLPAVGESGSSSGSAACTATIVQHDGAADTVLKHGWLHKRASNSIWQRRYFVITSSSIHYSNHALHTKQYAEQAHGRVAMPITEIHDAHPTGHGAEFNIFHKERLLRLRAPNAVEASAWVHAVIKASLDATGGKLRPTHSSGTVIRGMLCPSLHLSALDHTTGEAVEIDYLPDVLSNAAAQLGESTAFKEKLVAAALGAVSEGDGSLDMPLCAMCMYIHMYMYMCCTCAWLSGYAPVRYVHVHPHVHVLRMCMAL